MALNKTVSTIILLGLLTAGCSQREEILPGKREALRSPNPEALLDGAVDAGEAEDGDVTEDGDALDQAAANQALPIELPAPVNHANWTHPGGDASHGVAHAALSTTPQVVWSTGIGAGNSRRNRLTAEPVVQDGRIFTLDSRSTVAAVSAETGAVLWQAGLAPSIEGSDDATGGGLAVGSGILAVTTGFGELSALDPETGDVLWQQKLEAPVSGAPAVADGIVYVGGRDNRAWGVDATNGRVKWQLSNNPEITGVLGSGSPALTDRLALFPFASGEVMAALRKSGVRVWSGVVSGERSGRAYTGVRDFSGVPVVADGVIYAGTTSGRLGAMSTGGERIWTAREGAADAVSVAGGSVFVVSDQAELLRLDAETGERIWGVPLPYYTKERQRRRKGIFANYGPVLAGGRLWVGSSDGTLRGFDPVDGSEVAQVAIPGGAASRLLVVNGTAYLLSGKGQLLALR
ncbi:PQQ-binding-like beta-propeller repeat protein [Aliiroseovarius sp.]|uniref:outer membrane protein assembly factor BamB family protein n=1 Tax=Aliiroseovarius sp. TaxID=1872442 RepID=UPI003BAB441F